MLQSMGSQRVGHDLMTEKQQQQWCPMVSEAVFIFFILFLSVSQLIITFPYLFFYQFKYTAEIV